MELAGVEPAQAYFYAAVLQTVELMPLLSSSTKHFFMRLNLLCYCLQIYFVIACKSDSQYRSIALWVGLDSNQRVHRIEGYGLTASTTRPPTHKTIELRMDFPFKCFVGRAGFEPATPGGEPNLQSGGLNHSPTDPQSNRIIRFRLLQQIFKERPGKPGCGNPHRSALRVCD